MKTKLLIAPLMILLASVMVSSAGAIPETATPVTATMTGGGAFTGIVLNEGGVFFYDGINTGVVKLYITSTSVPDYVLSTKLILNGTINTKTNDGMIHYRMVWSYIVNNEVLGTFEGVAKADTTTYLYNPTTGYPRAQFSTNILHTVLQGNGVFQGQTLKLDGIRETLDYDPAPPLTPTPIANPAIWTGILLTR